MEKTKNDLIQVLMEVLQLEAVSSLRMFIEGEAALLFLLYQKNRPVPPTEIAKEMNISKGRVTAMLNSLNDKEYIDIAISSEDRRKFDITLTEQGLKFLNEKRKAAENYFDIMIARLGEEKSKQLVGIIEDIVRAMKE